jgi:hypothetical protein
MVRPSSTAKIRVLERICSDLPNIHYIGCGIHPIGFWNAQIPLMLKLRKDRRTKILLLLKLGIKVCRMITERYTHLILYKRQ